MNIILFEKKDQISDEDFFIDDYRAEHIVKVLRSKAGDVLSVGLVNGLMGSGTVKAIDGEGIKVACSFTQAPPDKLPLTLICALPRPKTMNRVLRYATGCGVKKIIFIESWKVEKSFWQSPMLAGDNVSRQLRLGLEQAKDTVLPEVHFYNRFKAFVEDLLPEICRDSLNYIAHPYSKGQLPSKSLRNTCLALGPEGGFTEYELGKFADCGFRALSFGARVLRCEVAVPYIIGQLF